MLALQCHLPGTPQLLQSAHLQATAGPSQVLRMKPTQPSTSALTCKAYSATFQSPYYQDNAYFSDEDVSDVEAVLSADAESSWLDANYVSLSVTCYKRPLWYPTHGDVREGQAPRLFDCDHMAHKLIQKQSREALQNHFAKQQGEARRAHSPAWPSLHHACCAPGRDHTFVCENCTNHVLKGFQLHNMQVRTKTLHGQLHQQASSLEITSLAHLERH